MRINEIIQVDPAAESFDAIKDKSSSNIYQLFNYIKERSENFKHSAAEKFYREEISDFLYELERFKETSPFSETDQVTAIVNSIYNYLKE